ncbi:MAG: hypothetical protein IT431_04480 [Phycisphaerales bacterium]|nr:hypothetical protein [Phycisphaerales bacterium]
MPTCRHALLAGLVIASELLGAQPESQPVPLPDYAARYHEYARSLQPGADNGWDLLTRITDLHREVATRHRDEAFELHDGGDVDYTLLWEPDSLDDEYTIESQIPRIEAQIQDARDSGLLDLLAQLSATDRLTMPTSGQPLLQLELPQLGWARALARLNGARMILAARDADHDQLAAAFGQNLWLTRAVPRSSPVLIGDLVGLAIDALTLQRVRGLLLAGQIDARLAQRLLDALDAAPPPLTMRQALDAEHFMRLDTINRLYTDDGAGDGRLNSDRLDFLGADADGASAFDAPAPGPGSTTFATKSQVIAREAEIHADLLAIAASHPQDREALAAPFEADFEDRRPHTVRGQANILFGILLPAIGKANRVHDQHALELAATRIMLAIEIHRARTGQPPAALADLTPGILPELPTDPYTRAPLIYAPTAGSTLGYTLYSAGFDQTDNNAKSSYDPDSRASELRALTPAGESTDYIFVPPTRDRRP